MSENKFYWRTHREHIGVARQLDIHYLLTDVGDRTVRLAHISYDGQNADWNFMPLIGLSGKRLERRIGNCSLEDAKREAEAMMQTALINERELVDMLIDRFDDENDAPTVLPYKLGQKVYSFVDTPGINRELEYVITDIHLSRGVNDKTRPTISFEAYCYDTENQELIDVLEFDEEDLNEWVFFTHQEKGVDENE